MGLVSKAAVGRHVGLWLVVAVLLAVPMGSADTSDEVLGALVQARPPCQGGLDGANPHVQWVEGYASSCGGAASTAAGNAATIVADAGVEAGQDAFNDAVGAAEQARDFVLAVGDTVVVTATGLADQAQNQVEKRHCSDGGTPFNQVMDCHRKVVYFVRDISTGS